MPQYIHRVRRFSSIFILACSLLSWGSVGCEAGNTGAKKKPSEDFVKAQIIAKRGFPFKQETVLYLGTGVSNRDYGDQYNSTTMGRGLYTQGSAVGLMRYSVVSKERANVSLTPEGDKFLMEGPKRETGVPQGQYTVKVHRCTLELKEITEILPVKRMGVVGAVVKYTVTVIPTPFGNLPVLSVRRDTVCASAKTKVYTQDFYRADGGWKIGSPF